MPLFVYPSIKTASIDDFENHIAAVRGRRIAGATVYFDGVNAKLQYASSVIEKRLQQQYAMLEKELSAMDKAADKVELRVQRIEELRQENDTLIDMQIQTGDED